jgi:uncharacterized membrane protein YkoI
MQINRAILSVVLGLLLIFGPSAQAFPGPGEKKAEAKKEGDKKEDGKKHEAKEKEEKDEAGDKGDDDEPTVKLPAAMLKALKAKFPHSEIEEVAIEVEEGQVIFEIELETKGGEYVVSMKADGTILEIERELKPTELPAAVAATLKRDFAGASITKAEEAIVALYEVTVVRKGQPDVEVVLDSGGKIVTKKVVGPEKGKKKD